MVGGFHNSMTRLLDMCTLPQEALTLPDSLIVPSMYPMVWMTFKFLLLVALSFEPLIYTPQRESMRCPQDLEASS